MKTELNSPFIKGEENPMKTELNSPFIKGGQGDFMISIIQKAYGPIAPVL